MSTSPPVLGFAQDRPFFPMVTAFLVSAVGLGPVFDPNNPLGLSSSQAAFFSGKVQPTLVIDMQQIRDMAAIAGADGALRSLCCMLVNTAYDTVEHQNDHLPEFEFFRHVRNASSHRNKFSFFPREPSRPASWRSLTIDHMRRGQANPLNGTLCFGGLLEPADAIFLLWDIEKKCT